MKRNLITIGLLGILMTVSYAQSQTDTSRVFKTHSLQFSVNSRFTLSSFNGALLSYKYHRNDANAFRVGVTMNVSRWDEEESMNSIGLDTTFLKLERDHNSSDIGIIIEYLRYFNSEREIKVFFGVGPRILFRLDDFDTENIDTLGNGFSYYDSQKYDYYELGVSFSFGVEWFFLSYMSLHAEYGAYLTYFYRDIFRKRISLPPSSTPQNYYENSEKSAGFEFSDRAVLFGLSVYF